MDNKVKKTNPFYLSRAWKDKRLEILSRDNYECQWCKAEGHVTTTDHSILEIDHIKELDDYPELALDDDNLRTLCKDCHNKRHERFQFSKKVKEIKWNDERWDW